MGRITGLQLLDHSLNPPHHLLTVRNGLLECQYCPIFIDRETSALLNTRSRPPAYAEYLVISPRLTPLSQPADPKASRLVPFIKGDNPALTWMLLKLLPFHITPPYSLIEGNRSPLVLPVSKELTVSLGVPVNPRIPPMG